MSNGFGAGFVVLAVVAVLAALALLLVLTTVGALASRRRTRRVPTVVRYLSVGLVTAVVALAGFGVLAFVDEAPPAVGLLVASVFLPLVVGGATVRRRHDLPWIETVAATGMAWCLPFLLGLGVVVGLTVGLGAIFDIPSASSRRLLVVWIAAAGGGLATVVGTVLLGGRTVGGLLTAPS